MLKRKEETPRGVLHFGRHEPFVGVERFEPSEGLRPFVEHYWSVTWKGQPRAARETIPHPSIHLVLEPGASKLHGVYPRRFTTHIEGDGRVLGVKFRPGGFRAFTKESVAGLTGKVLHPQAIFGPTIHELEAESTAYKESGDAFELIDDYLLQLQPAATAELELISRICTAIISDQSITRADTIVAQFQIGPRKLQRLFREYVGVSPKWVIQRSRLIEAAERIRKGEDSIDFAALAVELGYSDQAHFIRDFKTMVGLTPAAYRRSIA